jgi:hypothetical protein
VCSIHRKTHSYRELIQSSYDAVQFSTRSLLGFVAACALLVELASLPADFRNLLGVIAFLLFITGCYVHLAFAKHVPQWKSATVLIGWSLALSLAILLRLLQF